MAEIHDPRDSSLKKAEREALQQFGIFNLGRKQTQAEEELLQSQARDKDDLFSEGLFVGQSDKPTALIHPPFQPHVLQHLVFTNNALNQCISAYEVNIDGTGFVIEADQEDEMSTEQEEQAKGIDDFFAEVTPGVSFLTVRRELRRDQETTGNAYLEVIRTATGRIGALRRLDPKTIRLVKLDAPTPVLWKVNRFGEEAEISMMRRERRFAQSFGPGVNIRGGGTNQGGSGFESGGVIYFKEFGASRDVNWQTGEWAEQGALASDAMATEIVHFKVIEDVHTNYGVPRWINNLPSVIGSREAEELNLRFFRGGGIPPLLIAVEGGVLADDVTEALRRFFWNEAQEANTNRAAIVTVPNSGGLDGSTNNVRVRVEKFGGERQDDSLFEEYDANSEKRVRSSFRLPPIFVGRTEDFNFATAFASYTVAEAQVFDPERDEFDEVMNGTVIADINANQLDNPDPPYVMKSNPITVVDVQNKLRGIQLATGVATRESVVDALNEVVGLEFEATDEPAPGANTPPAGDTVGGDGGASATPGGEPSATQASGRRRTGVKLVPKADVVELEQLADEWANHMVAGSMHPTTLGALYGRIKQLSPEDVHAFEDSVILKVAGTGLAVDDDAARLLLSASYVAAVGTD